LLHVPGTLDFLELAIGGFAGARSCFKTPSPLFKTTLPVVTIGLPNSVVYKNSTYLEVMGHFPVPAEGRSAALKVKDTNIRESAVYNTRYMYRVGVSIFTIYYKEFREI
jgi:hypothetical protein